MAKETDRREVCDIDGEAGPPGWKPSRAWRPGHRRRR